MSGSIKNFVYTTDAGDDFVIRADESNTEAAGGAVDLAAGASTLYGLPRNVTPRYARYGNAAGTITRKCILCTVGATPTTPIIDSVSGESLDLLAIVGEYARVNNGTDTGLLDGDAT